MCCQFQMPLPLCTGVTFNETDNTSPGGDVLSCAVVILRWLLPSRGWVSRERKSEERVAKSACGTVQYQPTNQWLLGSREKSDPLWDCEPNCIHFLQPVEQTRIRWDCVGSFCFRWGRFQIIWLWSQPWLTTQWKMDGEKEEGETVRAGLWKRNIHFCYSSLFDC